MIDTISEIKKIHRDIFTRFKYIPDKVLWGIDEHWEKEDEIPDTGVIKGDCDCFALACRKECRKLDIPSRLVHVITETEEGHLVLSVEDWILDNRYTSIMRKRDLDELYKWIRISGYEKGDPWHMIE